jgi:hypothetical protein
MLLEDAGFEVFSALDGAHGLRLTRELHPDVILLDMTVVRLDAGRMALFWGGHASAWTPPAGVSDRVLARVELAELGDSAEARARLGQICV